MTKKVIITIAFTLFLSVCFHSAFAQINKAEKKILSDRLIENNPEYNFQYRSAKEVNQGDIKVRFFTYRSKIDNKIGGNGFELVNNSTNELLWYKMVPGDYALHSLAMVDLNKDNKPDLFYYAGFEDVFSTHIYLATYDEGGDFANDRFIPVYSNHNDYSVLIDPEGDNHPEILDSGYSGETHLSGLGCTGNPSGIIIDKNTQTTLSDSVRNEIASKYFEITGGFDDYNFDYAMPERHSIFNSFILSPIKIYRIEGQNPVNVTSSFPEYLQWRIRILKKIKTESPEKCRKRINNIIEYLDNKMNG